MLMLLLVLLIALMRLVRARVRQLVVEKGDGHADTTTRMLSCEERGHGGVGARRDLFAVVTLFFTFTCLHLGSLVCAGVPFVRSGLTMIVTVSIFASVCWGEARVLWSITIQAAMLG